MRQSPRGNIGAKGFPIFHKSHSRGLKPLKVIVDSATARWSVLVSNVERSAPQPSLSFQRIVGRFEADSLSQDAWSPIKKEALVVSRAFFSFLSLEPLKTPRL